MPADLQDSPVPLAEISQGPNAFEQFLDRNQKNIIVLAILLALGVAAYVIYDGIQKSRQETAGAALNKAEDLAALQAVISEHADTTAARSAMVLLADRQWNEGQQDAAIETLRKFISANPEHPALPSAKASLGSKLMSQGKAPEASDTLQSLVDDPNARFVAPYALITLGDIAKVAGDIEKAEASYNRVKTDFSDSSFAETATRRIATLKAKAPVEIAPPPKPEPPATPAADPAAGNAPKPNPGMPGLTVTPVEDSDPAPPQEAPPAPAGETKPETPPAAPKP